MMRHTHARTGASSFSSGVAAAAAAAAALLFLLSGERRAGRVVFLRCTSPAVAADRFDGAARFSGIVLVVFGITAEGVVPFTWCH